MRHPLHFFFLLLSGFLFKACHDTGPELMRHKPSRVASSSSRHKKEAGDIIQSIPNPLEICDLICALEKTNRPPFYVSESNDISKYHTSYKQAINLGIYRTNLFYANHYHKTEDILRYMKAINTLQSELAYASEAMQKRVNSLQEAIKERPRNIDSVIFVQGNLFFEDFESHFHQLDRTEINAWVELGSWIEGVYLVTLHYENQPDSILRDKIAEQKIILAQLLRLTEIYRNRPAFEQMHRKITELSILYKPVLPDQYGIYTISDGQLRKICSKIKHIRGEVIG